VPLPGRAGEQVVVQLRERGLYTSRGDGLEIRFTAQPYVYRVEPSRVLISRFTTLVKVFVADTERLATQTSSQGYFCKFGSRAVRAHAVRVVTDLSEDRLAPHGLAQLPTVVRREVLCHSPLESTAQTVPVEVLIPGGGTFSTNSLNATLTYVARPFF
jgi:hypothetical protein